MSSEIIVVPGVQWTHNSLVINNGLVFDEWLRLMDGLSRIEDGNQWWIGDGLNAGEHAYGEMYAQAVDESKAKTWANNKWVAKYIKSSRRRELSWSHHAEVAGMDEDDQEILLDKAVKHGWSRAQLRKEKKKHERAKLIDASAPTEGPLFRLIHDDVAGGMQQLDRRSIDVIITDPPYPEEYLPLFDVLSEEAKRVLKPGGLAVVMVGQSYLPEIMRRMEQHLKYHWTSCYHAPGASTQLWQRKVLTQWKPLLIFSSGEYDGEWLYDVVKSDKPDKDKHDWGQSESGMSDVVKRYSQENDLILDPFCGAGTTGVMALDNERRFIGIDNDKKQIEITAGRIAAWQNEQDGETKA